jgi:Cell wall-active antibiotics response 4TMS YvqF
VTQGPGDDGTSPQPAPPDRIITSPRRPSGAAPAPRPGRPLPLGAIVLGVVLVGAGVAWLLEITDTARVPWGGLAPAALVLVGVALVVAAWTRSKSGVLVAAGVILALVAALFAEMDVTLRGGVGDRTERPQRAAELRNAYDLAAGKLVLDLSRLEVPVGTTKVGATVALGELEVIVPREGVLFIQAEVTAGSVQLLSRSADGVGASTAYRDAGYGGGDHRLELDLNVGLGEIEVRR